MPKFIALIRGINVGRAKRIAMPELRAMVEGLGFDGVRTLRSSGNVVFEAPLPDAAAIAHSIEAGIAASFEFRARVLVVTAPDLRTIVNENPLREIAADSSRYMVAFVARASMLANAKPLLEVDWTPEALSIGANAAYLWCADGVADSKLAKAFGRVMGDATTTRNWATVLKLHAAVQPSAGRT